MNQLLAMRAFVRVVDTGSFSRASDQLGMPRSTVSKLIGDLEVHLGNQLMLRTTRSVAPTADGLAYYQHAARLLAELDEMDHAMRGQKRKPRGHLRIDAPAAFATSLLVPAAAIPARISGYHARARDQRPPREHHRRRRRLRDPGRRHQ